MVKPLTSTYSLAERLLALESENPSAMETGSLETEGRVIEKLRFSLTRLAGGDGVAALLQRALDLASSDVPALQSVTVTNDGCLEGLEAIAADDKDLGTATALAITAHLLRLLAAFIGEPLTVRLMREIWPDVSVDNKDRSEIS